MAQFARRGPSSRRFYRVLFFGTDHVSLETLTRLHASLLGAGPHAGLVAGLGVVCPGPRPQGRGRVVQATPVGAYCATSAPLLPLFEVPYTLRDLAGWGGTPRGGAWDVGVVVSFGYFLPPAVLSALPLGAINMHPSKLPRHRGAAPVARALLAGDAVTAVTVVEVHPSRFDAGRVLLQEDVEVGAAEGAVALTRRLAAMGGDALMRALAALPALRTAAAPQEEARATAAQKLRAEEARVEWATCTAEALLRRARAFEGSIGQFAALERGAAAAAAAVPSPRMNLLALAPVAPRAAAALAAAAAAAPAPTPPGALFCDMSGKPRRLFVACVGGGWVEVEALQLEGGKAMTGAAFLNGLRCVAGAGVRDTGARCT
jgi:methionyl-tRNA formyltransferase